MARKTISQRIALVGGDEIKKQLGQFGQAGEKAFGDVQAAAEKLKGPGADFARSMDAIQKKVREVGESVKEAGEKMRNFGAGLSVAVTAPVGLMGRSFIQAASDAQEAGSAFDFLFEESAGSVRDWSKEVAGSLGRGTQAIQDQVASFQQLFAQVQPNREAAVSLSKDFTVLAQDLSSFFNVAEGDAMAKLQSGLAGSAEPLRAFGVFLNENAVSAKALEMGLGGVNGVLTDQEKVLARAAIIMEQTSAAQGDAARTSDSYANQLKRLSGLWQDLSVTLGEIILPVALKVVQAFADAVSAIQSLPAPMQTMIVVAAGLAAAAGPLIMGIGALVMGLGGMASGFAALMPLVVGATGAIAALGGTITGLLAPAAAFLGWPVALAAALGFLAVQVFIHRDAIVGAIVGMMDTVKAAARAAWDALPVGLREAIESIRMVFSQIVDDIRGKFEWLAGRVDAVVDRIKSAIASIKSAISSAVPESLRRAAEPGSGIFGFAGGGSVRGPGTATSDSILARLSDGEFVVRARAVRHYGADLFRRLNSMTFSGGSMLGGYASGGLVSGATVPVAAGSSSGPSGPYANLNLSIGGETFGGLMAPRETADRLVRYALHEEAKSAGRRPGWYKGG